jgi:phytoene dehydrogenase-like protein
MSERSVIVVGGGHNGLVAAILAARHGYRVTLLERSDHLGGASVGAAVFSGHDVRLSRYSYLVALFPDELAARLGIDLPLASRAVSSYTPVIRGHRPGGLLVERVPGAATEQSFLELTGSGTEYRAWTDFYGDVADAARVIAPVLRGPLRRRAEVRDAVIAAAGAQLWTDLAEIPIGEAISRRFADDTVRGVVATDALIGTHTSLFDASLLANRCFLYHLVGRGSGEWLVPIGGMGAVADRLVARARELRVDIRTGVEVHAAAEDRHRVTLVSRDGSGAEVDHAADWVLAGVAPAVVQGWLGRPAEPPIGAQLKINMLLRRLPRLASGADPAVAFAGTTHLEEGLAAVESAYATSVSGAIADPLPCEVYCHSLTDPTIMNGEPGHTLTLFGLHTPVGLFRADPDGARERAAAAALGALQRHLAEPLTDCLATDSEGRPCLEVSSPQDIEDAVAMPGGNIFHADLAWPWLADGEEPDGPAGAYGVQIPGAARILLAGAGSRRGGGVSGLGGEAAVDALLAMS